jgi:hypothetical protein
LRLATHLPWHHAIVRQVLRRRSEISFEESRFLGSLVQAAPSDHPIIEIGTLFGASTRVIMLFKDPATPLITVDSFQWNPFGLARDQHAALTKEFLADGALHHNVTLCEMDKETFYSTYRGVAPGLVFLDANHGYESTKNDLAWALGIGASIVCGHDYSPKFPGVVKAVDEAGGARRMVGALFELARSGQTLTG